MKSSNQNGKIPKQRTTNSQLNKKKLLFLCFSFFYVGSNKYMLCMEHGNKRYKCIGRGEKKTNMMKIECVLEFGVMN